MWTKLQNLRWYLRWPIKWAVVALAAFLVSFPNPVVFVRHVQHSRNPNAMIDPDLPELQPWVQDVKERLDPAMPPPTALKLVQRFVYEKVPYEFDWETWGCADYLPTLPEVLEMGAEDCDGQAVVAASLLRNLGYKAELVSDFTHVWVKTDKGDTMSPGKKRSVVATREGLRIDWKTLAETVPRAVGVGISLFPLVRELIVLGVLWIVLLRPGASWPVRLVCLLVMLDGLILVRAGGFNHRQPDAAVQWWGAAQVGGAVLAMLIFGRRATRSAGADAAEPAG